MALTEVAGRRYGPFPLRVAPEKVDEFVAATGDSAARWDAAAPPGFAAAILFVAAPAFFSDPAVEPFTKVLVHAEQRFRWHAPLQRGQELTLSATAESVRERRGLNFVSFSVEADSGDDRVLECESQFIMAESPGGGLDVAERPQVAVHAKAYDEVPAPVELPPPGGALPDLHKSASRADLVRYAGATRDWNPIHWDHDAAVASGLGGVVVHGLLMASWVMQAATRTSTHAAPLRSARFRFRKPMPVGSAGIVTAAVGEAQEGTSMSVALRSGEGDLVIGDLMLQVG